MADEKNEVETRRLLDVVQGMIDISADRLEGLRTQCATSAELTQHEIRTLEGKLVKLYSRQIVTKAKLLEEGKLPIEYQNMPTITQWLQVVGLSDDSIQAVCHRVKTLEALLDKTEHELKTILNDRNARAEEVRRLSRALHNVKRYTEVLVKGDIAKEPSELYWDSWDRHHLLQTSVSPRLRNRTTRKSVPSEEGLHVNGNSNQNEAHDHCSPELLSLQFNSISNLPSVSKDTLSNSFQSLKSLDSVKSFTNSGKLQQTSKHTLYSSSNLHFNSKGLNSNASCSESHLAITPSESINSMQTPSPSEDVPPQSPLQKNKAQTDRKFPTTPPPRRKHQTLLQTNTNHNQNLTAPDIFPLTKSKSHESQLGKRVEKDNKDPSNENNTENKDTSDIKLVTGRNRLNTEPGPNEGYNTPNLQSPIKSPPSVAPVETEENKCISNLQVPRSPRTPTVTRAGMGHVISHRFTKTFKMMSTCDYCFKQMFIGTGLKCKECKYRCHKDCEPHVAPSCCLPPELMDEFKKHCVAPNMFLPSPSPGRASPGGIFSNTFRKDIIRTHPPPHAISVAPFQGPDSSSNTSSCNSSAPSSPALQQQNTPQTPHQSGKQQFHFPDVGQDKGVTLETHPLHSNMSTDLVDTIQSNDSDKTVSLSGSNSTDSERTPIRVDSQDGESASESTRWPRQNSLSMREWDIPFDELHMLEAIGTGRFGTVHRGLWHGDVAIKILSMDYQDGEKTLEAFKLEVATFRKTRHDNLVLFMGACMKPPRLAIVTSLCKGMTLYTHIHLRKDKFNMNRTTLVAQQISQGMGYLHARGIVHKDLKSKNIFLENGKVVITDFGLFSVTKLCYSNRKGDSLGIPAGWLCYLAPEVVRSLRAHQKCDEEELPFTKSSDVYAFGTVWYELLCGEWPFKGQPPEAIIWQVGRGMKQTLANLQASRDVKDILMQCWSYRSESRPDFGRLLNILEKLPKKRLARSPSHPVHLSRSAESVF